MKNSAIGLIDGRYDKTIPTRQNGASKLFPLYLIAVRMSRRKIRLRTGFRAKYKYSFVTE
jgi:hypothetical protein